MYLRGSKWTMTKRRKPINYLSIIVLAILVFISLRLAPLVSTVETPWNPTPTPTRPPESFVTEAEQLFAQGKMSQAIDSYQQAIASAPNNPANAAVYVAMAQVQVWNGQFLDAQSNAENALLLNQESSMAHAVRGWALSNQGDFLAAEASIKRALELDPNNAKAHAYYAELLTDMYFDNQGGLDIVERMSEESKVALSLGSNTMEAHRARGYVYEATGNYQEAIGEYQAAVQINANIADLYLSLGRPYRLLGIYDQAVDALSRANALNPADPTPDLIISRIYYTTGEYAKAEQYAEQALKDSPGDPAMHANTGLMYYKNFKYPEAVAELGYFVKGGTTEDGLEITPVELAPDSARIAEYYFTYGLALAKMIPPQCAQALPIAQQILTKIPGDEISVFNANEIYRLCSEAAGSPTLSETPTGQPESLEATPTP
jgi:tetratricopeptide (TPR) repeat protein